MRRRRSVRLPGFDYSQRGSYFVTICTRGGTHWFGTVEAGSARLSSAGAIVADEWSRLPQRYPHVGTEEFVVMPNHVHGILLLGFEERDGEGLGAVVRGFKAATARRIRATGDVAFAWQRNYYEHVIRSDDSRDRIRGYIRSNPQRWHLDPENADRVGNDDAGWAR